MISKRYELEREGPKMLSDVDICHGTLVIHAASGAECTEPDCVDLEYVRHVLILECQEVTGGCRCTHIALAQAS